MESHETERVDWVSFNVDTIATADECSRIMQLCARDVDRVAETISRWKSAAYTDRQYVDGDRYRRTEHALKAIKRRYNELCARRGVLSRSEKAAAHAAAELERGARQRSVDSYFREIVRESVDPETYAPDNAASPVNC